MNEKGCNDSLPDDVIVPGSMALAWSRWRHGTRTPERDANGYWNFPDFFLMAFLLWGAFHAGRALIADNNGVHEVDPTGKEIRWQHKQNNSSGVSQF